eukprot:g1434.t1
MESTVGTAVTREIPSVSNNDTQLKLEQIPNSAELLAYYRKRVEDVEADQKEFLRKIAEVEVAHDELHRVQWDNRVRQEEIAELQRALSDANIMLFDEREQVLKLQAANSRHVLNNMEDRKRIQHLLALTQPVTQEVTFFRDCRPNKMTRYHRSTASEENMTAALAEDSVGAGKNTESKITGTLVTTRGTSAGESNVSRSMSKFSGPQPYKTRVLRTIYMPNERADALQGHIDKIEGHIEKVKEIEGGRNRALLADRARMADQYRKRRLTDQETLSIMEEKWRKCMESHRKTTKEYLELRHDTQVQYRLLKEENEALRAQNDALRRETSDIGRRAAMEAQAFREKTTKAGELYADQFRQQALSREEDLCVLREQYTQVQTMYETRIKELEKKYSKLSKAHTSLKKRRAMDFEGFRRDVSALRQHLKYLEAKTETKKKKKRKKKKRSQPLLNSIVRLENDYTTGAKGKSRMRSRKKKTQLMENTVTDISSAMQTNLGENETVEEGEKPVVEKSLEVLFENRSEEVEDETDGLEKELQILKSRMRNLEESMEDAVDNLS